jgi:hypothetical protein
MDLASPINSDTQKNYLNQKDQFVSQLNRRLILMRKKTNSRWIKL